MRRLATLGLLLAALTASAAARADAQVLTPDTLRLDALYLAAERNDPRTRELAIRDEQTALRLRTIANERLPAFSATSEEQYQSVVTQFPGGVARPGQSLLHDTFDANLQLTQSVFDPSRTARAEVERAQLARNRADVLTALYSTRQQVNTAFFQVAELSERHDAVLATITDLEAQARVAEARVRNGEALTSELSAVRAELLRRRQDDEQILAERGAAMRVLADLTGVPVRSNAPVILPALERTVAEARARDTVKARPEFVRFARSRELLTRQSEVLDSQLKPRVSAFLRGGAGRPGLNILNTTLQQYWIAGVQLQWTPLDWGHSARDRESLALERGVVDAEAQAFADALRRETMSDLATIDRLQRALASDDEIVALREQIVRETTARFRESAVTAAEFVDRETDLLSARITRAQHRVELAQARANYLTTLGVQVH
ncbi:MAG TPA: TolC family protein [Gemmatimonadaceae bacterium]